MDFNYIIDVNKIEEYLSSFNEAKARVNDKINSFESSNFSRSDNYKLNEMYNSIKTYLDKIKSVNNNISNKLDGYINAISDKEKSMMDFSAGAQLGDFNTLVSSLSITNSIDSRVIPVLEDNMDYNKDLGKLLDPYEFALTVLSSKKQINGKWYYVDKNGRRYALDFDGIEKIQCVDGFKIWYAMIFGVELKDIPKTGNNNADGYNKLFEDKPNYFKNKFEKINKPKEFRDGDILIWNRGGDTHKYGHISFAFKIDGKWYQLGQRQGGDRSFRLSELSEADIKDVAAVLRPHVYDKYFDSGSK